MSVLKIRPGQVLLPGYAYGFLGGTSGRIGDKIVFNGDLSAHPDFNVISAFIESRGLSCVYFKDYPLTDIGSIIVEPDSDGMLRHIRLLENLPRQFFFFLWRKSFVKLLDLFFTHKIALRRMISSRNAAEIARCEFLHQEVWADIFSWFFSSYIHFSISLKNLSASSFAASRAFSSSALSKTLYSVNIGA